MFDAAVISAVQSLESLFLTLIMEFFTIVGSTKVVVILCLLILFFLYKVLHHRHELLLFIVVVAGSPLLNLCPERNLSENTSRFTSTD